MQLTLMYIRSLYPPTMLLPFLSLIFLVYPLFSLLMQITCLIKSTSFIVLHSLLGLRLFVSQRHGLMCPCLIHYAACMVMLFIDVTDSLALAVE